SRASPGSAAAVAAFKFDMQGYPARCAEACARRLDCDARDAAPGGLGRPLRRARQLRRETKHAPTARISHTSAQEEVSAAWPDCIAAKRVRLVGRGQRRLHAPGAATSRVVMQGCFR